MPVVRITEENGDVYIVLDSVVQDALSLKDGDELEVRVDKDGVHLSPSEFSSPEIRAAFGRVVQQYDETLKKLAQ